MAAASTGAQCPRVALRHAGAGRCGSYARWPGWLPPASTGGWRGGGRPAPHAATAASALALGAPGVASLPPPPPPPPPPTHTGRWEEEDDWDALTDALAEKLVVLAAAPAGPAEAGQVEQVPVCGALGLQPPCLHPPLQPSPAARPTAPGPPSQLRAALEPLTFAQAFTSAGAEGFAAQLWEGRAGPPYFLRPRRRDALDAAAAGEQDGGAAAAAEVWGELLSQNWRVELDYGLGTAVQQAEVLLVVAAPAAVRQLLRAAAGEGAAGGDGKAQPASLSAVRVGATNVGDRTDWQLLAKQVVAVGETGRLSGWEAVLAPTGSER